MSDYRDITAIGSLLNKNKMNSKFSNNKYILEKEKEFLRLVCSDLSYKEIAEKMFVSQRRVDDHRDALFEKLKLRSRVGLVLYAIKNGIFEI